jgi:serine/threonine protein kinase
VAVKTFGEEMFTDEDKVNAFRDELALLQKIRHPNVVQFLGAVTQSTPMMIVTEYLPKVLIFLNLNNHIQRMYDLSRFTNYHLRFKIHHEH